MIRKRTVLSVALVLALVAINFSPLATFVSPWLSPVFQFWVWLLSPVVLLIPIVILTRDN